MLKKRRLCEMFYVAAFYSIEAVDICYSCVLPVFRELTILILLFCQSGFIVSDFILFIRNENSYFVEVYAFCELVSKVNL